MKKHPLFVLISMLVMSSLVLSACDVSEDFMRKIFSQKKHTLKNLLLKKQRKKVVTLL